MNLRRLESDPTRIYEPFAEAPSQCLAADFPFWEPQRPTKVTIRQESVGDRPIVTHKETSSGQIG
jgi:hypothetical protein